MCERAAVRLDSMTNDEAMERALALAQQAAAEDDVPVGAVVLDTEGRVIGEGRNRREDDGDPLAHAEVLAMRQAARRRVAESGPIVATADATGPRPDTDATGPGADAVRVGVADARRAWNLADCTLVVTLEPCPMCAGACLQTHIGRIVFGAWDAKLGACGSVWDIPRDPHIGHSPEVIGGVREGECAALLGEFFASRR